MEKRSKAIDGKKDSSGILEKRWYAYALAGAGALAAAPAAHASIVYTGPSSPSFPSPSTSSAVGLFSSGAVISIDLDNAGNGTFTLQATNSSSYGILAYGKGAGANPAGDYTNGTTANAVQFAFGSTIGPAAVGFSYRNFSHAIGSSWWNGDAYLGLEFNLPTVGNVFGWAELGFTGGGDNDYVVTLEGYAYQNVANTAINAGDTGTTPEPGTAGLLLLGLGASGLAAWRKRKQAQRAA